MTDQRYIVITKNISGYGPRPWAIGAYFPEWQVGEEIVRAWVSAAIGLGLLVLALIAAIFLGKRLARPIKAIAAQAHLVADFDLDDVTAAAAQPGARVRRPGHRPSMPC